MSKRKLNIFSLICCVAMVASILGCGGVDLKTEFVKANESNAAKVRSFYLIYKSKNSMKAPKNKEELIKFMNDRPDAFAKNFELLGIDQSKAEECFVSERDGKELKIRWGVDGVVTPMIVFEQEGVDGELIVAGEMVKKVSKEEADRLWGEKAEELPGTEGS